MWRVGCVNPRLVAITGPLKDQTFGIPQGELSIGREGSNLLPISDPALSRRHCAIVGNGEKFTIRDLGSRNGTLINGVTVKEQPLNHGDRIEIGDSVFIFLLHEHDESLSQVEFDESGLTTSAVWLRHEDALYLQPDKLLSAVPATARLARNLNALLKISRAVHSVRGLDELQEQILTLIFEVAPAERGAILMATPSLEIASVFSRDQKSSGKPMTVSSTVTRQVLQKGAAVLSNDVQASELAVAQSIVAAQVRSIMCVPLALFDKIVGCIYLDTRNPLIQFTEEHLQLVTAIAAISASALETARDLEKLREENERLNTEINLEHNMIGDSPRMREVYQFLARVAPSDSTVLIHGESGTGKELAARAIHRNSPRTSQPFIAINCAAITETLLESELFGHERGAFTGAVAQKKGKIEVADGGTLFLDEISELAPSLQAKLLRVLQEREFERVGGTRTVKVNVRVIAATNKDLGEQVKAGAFRQDLFYRLNVVAFTMPPLRERRDDIPLLANYFITKHAAKCKVHPRPLSKEGRACLLNYDWPGNVRELENAIERALVLGGGEAILPEDLPEPVLDRESTSGTSGKYHAALTEMKKQLILKALDDSNGNYTEAAKLLGVHPNYLHRLIRNLDLKAAARSSQAMRKTS